MGEMMQLRTLLGDALKSLRCAERIMAGFGVNRLPMPLEIATTVCNQLELDILKVRSKSRKRELVDARYIIMTLIKETWPTMSLSAIGKEVGRLDHSTVLNGLRVHRNLLGTNPEYTEKFYGCEAIINEKFNTQISINHG